MIYIRIKFGITKLEDCICKLLTLPSYSYRISFR